MRSEPGRSLVEGPWDPLRPEEVASLFAELDAPWWIAGGYAIEAFVGHAFRGHNDIDVGLLRNAQSTVQAHLASWALHAADPPGTLRPWLRGETLPTGVHDIWARQGPGERWRFQLMLNDEADGEWLFRRDPRIRRPLASCVWQKDGIPYLVAEVQLLFKAKAPRPRDEADFEAALPLLDGSQRRWLHGALNLLHPISPWLARLTPK